MAENQTETETETTPETTPAAKRSMAFEYRPNGVPEEKWQRWPFEPGRMSNREAEAIEDVTGWTFVHWQSMFFSGSIRAIHALLWVYLRRDRSKLKYDEVEFTEHETWFGFVDEHGNPIPDDDLDDDNEDDDETSSASDGDDSDPKDPES